MHHGRQNSSPKSLGAIIYVKQDNAIMKSILSTKERFWPLGTTLGVRETECNLPHNVHDKLKHNITRYQRLDENVISSMQSPIYEARMRPNAWDLTVRYFLQSETKTKTKLPQRKERHTVPNIFFLVGLY